MASGLIFFNMNSRIVRWAVLIIGVVLFVRLAGNVLRLVNAGGRVADEEKKLKAAQALTQQLKGQLAQVQTPEYMEREAREKLGYGKPGEVVLVMPPQDQITNNKLQITNQDQQNWVKWRKLYLGF